MDALRRNIGFGTLGFKLSSILLQPTSLLDAAGYIGGDFVLKGVELVTTSEQWADLMLKLPEIRHRMGDDPAYIEFLSGKTSSSFLFNIQQAGMRPMQRLDMFAAIATAAGAYDKYMTEKGLPVDFNNINPEAAEYAQRVVVRTQSSGFFLHSTPAATRGALTGNVSLDKTILAFQNFIINRFSNIHELKADIKRGDIGAASGRITFALLAILAGQMLRYGFSRLYDLIKDDENEYDWTNNIIAEILQNIPILGSPLSAIAGNRKANFPIPMVQVIDNAIMGTQRLIRGKKGATKLKGLIDTMTATGQLSGVPGSVEAGTILKKLVDRTTKKKKRKLKRRKPRRKSK
jgi:hypothetical protein